MRILLDNNVTHRLAPLIIGHEVIHCRQLGWAGLQKGDLIAAAEKAEFEAILTADKNMQYQQNIKGRKISILLLSNIRITINHLRPLVPNILLAVEDLPVGSFHTITINGIE